MLKALSAKQMHAQAGPSDDCSAKVAVAHRLLERS